MTTANAVTTLPAPYYERDGITIYHADCRDILPLLPAGSVDLVLTDPPYNAGVDYGTGTDDKMEWAEYVSWLMPIISESERVSQALVMVFTSISGMLHLSAKLKPRWVCAWNKPISFSHRVGGSPFLPHWEPCLVYGKPWGDGGRVPSYSFSDVWSFNTAARNGHPCPKPETLLRKIIGSIPGDTILDPFMGSGTTLVAAKQLGRRAIGIEIEERYCAIAVKRLAQMVMPL